MVEGFWKKLKKPIFVLAPMANVTDAAFRRIIAKYGKPDVTWTEFVSADGLFSPGREKLMMDLWFAKQERPIVAQLFSAKPELMYQAAQLAQELGFDGIDINMGCPDKGVEKQGAGAALMKNPKLAQKIIQETQRGAGKLPVSIKTRIGYNKIELDTWLPALLETEPAAITFHLRTRKEMSKVPARWELMTEVMELVQKYDSSRNRTLILGNGDVENILDAKEKVKMYGIDGVMIGRGIFGNPWCFANSVRAKNDDRIQHPDESSESGLPSVSPREKLSVMLEHTKLFCELYKINPKTGKGLKDFNVMKKHYKAYVSGFDGAKELRVQLMEAKNIEEIEDLVTGWKL